MSKVKGLFFDQYDAARLWWIILLVASAVVAFFVTIAHWADSSDRDTRRDRCRDLGRVIQTEWQLDENNVCWLKVEDRWTKA